MTASTTPNLGLMSPVRADAFQPQDFRDTFGILDENPGILRIPNEASRPTGYGADQHGRIVWQADHNIMWVWRQPSAATAGYWDRLATKGHIGGAINHDWVNTTAQSVATAPTVTSVDVMVPGGRPILIVYHWLWVVNNHARQVTINFMANNSSFSEKRFNGVGFAVSDTSQHDPPHSAMYYEMYSPGGSQRQINFSYRVRAQDPSVAGPYQGGGTSSIRGGAMDIIEV